MALPSPLDASVLRWQCDPKSLGFETTDELPDLDTMLGQERALQAVQFGIQIRKKGYNLYALGPPGMGKRSIVEEFLKRRSMDEPKPSDWCYVHNFEDPHRPRALELPPGRGVELRRHMQLLVEDLRATIPAALAEETHQNRLQQIETEAKRAQEQAFDALAEKALQRGVQILRTPSGFAVAPVHNGQAMRKEDYEKLPEKQRVALDESLADVQEEIQQFMEKIPVWRHEARERIRELNRQAAAFAVTHSLAHIKRYYKDLPHVMEYLSEVEQDVLEHSADFSPQQEEEPKSPFPIESSPELTFRRYQVNVLVDHRQGAGAPVVYEDHPTLQNLLGRVEHRAQMGMLLADFTLIKPGALHRANGGYLVFEAHRLFQQPFAWEALKRALQSGCVRIESPADAMATVSTVSLSPEPIPLDVKVVMLGERSLYYLLYQHDRDFPELFKVAVDFDDRMDRSEEHCRQYARLVATLARRQENRPLTANAVARVVEHSARLAEDSEKLTTHMRTIADLLHEADYWAEKAKVDRISREHIEQAIDQQIYRSDRLRQRVQEEIQRNSLLIDTTGMKTGQVNGLSVLDMGNFAFGRPSRITATVRVGRGEVVDIEREVELGGAIHSKGVLILASLLAARYAQDHPLSLAASLVFEQSYGMVDGDSASVAEWCALLSALADVPIQQSLAVTGSVNQMGQIQAIGGVHEKIEGFFDVCCARGLTGQQGVLIPEANVKNLMLRDDVVQAARDGNFHIYAVAHVDQAISLLTGLDAGQRDDQGQFTEGTINHKVQVRLNRFFELRRQLNATQSPESPRR